MSEVRLIDANALFNWGKYKLSDAVKYGNKCADQQHFSYGTLMMYEIADEISDAPTIDAVPVVRGKWIPNQHWEYRNGNTTMSGDTGLGCSACGAVNFTGINQRTPFCPHCGAQMDGEP